MSDEKNYELIKVFQLNRYGATTTIGDFKDILEAAFGSGGQLTSNGFRQLVTLGETMRNKYIKSGFLNDNTNNIAKDFKLFSTKSQRCIYSSIAFVNGLFPGIMPEVIFHRTDELKSMKTNDSAPVKGEFAKYNFKKNEIEKNLEIHVRPIENDTILHTKYCLLNGKMINVLLQEHEKIHIEELKKEKKLPDIINISANEKKAQNEILEKMCLIKEEDLKDENGKIRDIEDLEHVLMTIPYHLNKSPFSKDISKEGRYFYVKYFIYKRFGANFFKDDELIYIICSHLYQIIIDEFLKSKNVKEEELGKIKLNGKKIKNRKYIVDTCHDGNILPIIMTLYDRDYLIKVLNEAPEKKEAFDFILIPFASSLIFELLRNKKDGKYYVKVYYNGKLIKGTMRKLVNKDGSKEDISSTGIIDFDKFVLLLKSIINPKYKELDGKHLKEIE